MTTDEALTTLIAAGCRFTIECDEGNGVRLTLSRPGGDLGRSQGARVSAVYERGPLDEVLQRAAARVLAATVD